MKKYNNADSVLAGDLQASGMAFILKSGEGDLFPSDGFPYDVTAEHYEGDIVTKREIITISNRTGDAFTISARHSQSCVQDDSAETKTRTANALSFVSGDRVYLTITESDINTIETEIYTNIPADLDLKLDESVYNAEKIAYASTSTGNDDYAITVSGITSYNLGQTFKVKADIANTGSATLNINSLGAKTLKKLKTGAFSDLETGDIIANQIFFATYNGTDFQFSIDPATATIPDVEATKKTFVAGENITAGNALYILPADGKAYKTDATNTDKIQLAGFATNTVSTGGNVVADTSGISSTQSGLTIGSDYFLAGGTTLTSQLLTNNTSNIGYNTTTYNYKEGQTFQLSSGSNGIKTIVKLRKVGSPTDNILVKLYASDKTTLLGTSNSIAGTTLTTGGIDYTFTISGVSLSSGTEYFISVERDGAVSTSNYYQIDRYTVASNVYTSGAMYTYNNSTFVWDLFISGSDYTDLYFYITQDGAGTISTTPGTNIISVGKAVSATGIEINLDRVKQLGVITPTVGASPYTYQNTNGRPVLVSVTSGTVSLIQFSRDNTNFYTTAVATNTAVYLGINDYVKVTYSVIPTLKVFTF